MIETYGLLWVVSFCFCLFIIVIAAVLNKKISGWLVLSLFFGPFGLALLVIVITMKKMSLVRQPNIDKLKFKRNIKGLIKAIGYRKSDWVRRDAGRALKEIADAQAVEPLIKALKDINCDVRYAAALSLGVVSDSRATEPLIASLNDSDGYVRRAATEALGKIGNPRAVKPLVAALSDNDEYMREKAATALGKIGDNHAVEPLIKALQDGKSNVREAAATALGQLKHPSAWEPLMACLNDLNFGVQRVVYTALKQIKLPSDQAAQARYWIATKEWDKIVSLGAIAVDPLIKVFMEGESDVRASAAKILGGIGDVRAVSPFIAVLNDWYDVSPKAIAFDNVREAVVEALGKIGDVRAIEPLTLVLRYEWGERRNAENTIYDTSASVRKAAAEALDKLGWQPDCSETGAGYWGAKEKWNKCAEIGAPAVRFLIAALESYDIFNVVDTLLHIGDVRAVDPIMAILKEEYEKSSGIIHKDGTIELVPEVRGLGGRIAFAALTRESVKSMFATGGWAIRRETRTVPCTNCQASGKVHDIDTDIFEICIPCKGTGKFLQERALFERGNVRILVALQ